MSFPSLIKHPCHAGSAARLRTAAARLAASVAAAGLAACQSQKSQTPEPVDAQVTAETRALLASIHDLGWSDKIALGQEMPYTFSRAEGFKEDLAQSDFQDVVGARPGLYGGDFHYIVDKPDQRAAQIEAARKAHDEGAIVIFNYHWQGKYEETYSYTPENAAVLARVVAGDDSQGDVTWFYQDLDALLAVINEELRFPMVFRPLHEMNGNWFWWGSRMEGGAEVYRRAFQLVVEYMSQRTEYLLYCWSPDKAMPEEFYPGDDHVDVIGLDAYSIGLVDYLPVDKMIALLEQLVDFADARGKVAAFTETGATTDPAFNYTLEASNWWTEQLLPALTASEKTRKIAWVQTWINSTWSGPYLPHEGAPAAAIEDFRAFCAHPYILLQPEIDELDVYGGGE